MGWPTGGVKVGDGVPEGQRRGGRRRRGSRPSTNRGGVGWQGYGVRRKAHNPLRVTQGENLPSTPYRRGRTFFFPPRAVWYVIEACVLPAVGNPLTHSSTEPCSVPIADGQSVGAGVPYPRGGLGGGLGDTGHHHVHRLREHHRGAPYEGGGSWWGGGWEWWGGSGGGGRGSG